MLVILFRSKLTAQAGADYAAMNDELEKLVRGNPGFIDVKSFQAADGERLTLVWWRDAESLHAWSTLPRHLEAKSTGRERWYQFYDMEVTEVVRESHFKR
jgi:heme-degrading monooxygenase HmoA